MNKVVVIMIRKGCHLSKQMCKYHICGHIVELRILKTGHPIITMNVDTWGIMASTRRCKQEKLTLTITHCFHLKDYSNKWINCNTCNFMPLYHVVLYNTSWGATVPHSNPEAELIIKGSKGYNEWTELRNKSWVNISQAAHETNFLHTTCRRKIDWLPWGQLLADTPTLIDCL